MSEHEVMILAEPLGQFSVKTYELKIEFGLPCENFAQDLPVEDFFKALLNARSNVVHDHGTFSGADRIREWWRQWDACACRAIKIGFHSVQCYLRQFWGRATGH